MEQPGIVATLTAGEVSVERTLPTLSFDLDVDEALDWRLPAGGFSGLFTVRTAPGTAAAHTSARRSAAGS